MLIVLVDIYVLPEFRDAFVLATTKNANASRLEPGVARFDVLADQADSQHFQLLEAYRTPEAPAAHKATRHYAEWRVAVTEMMARPRTSTKFENLSPGDEDFG